VQGLSVVEIQRLIQQRIDKDLIDALVYVQLISFRVYFLGEAGLQGSLTFYEPNVNIIKAMALAGGVNSQGNKRKIMILREKPGGHEILYVDITDRNILESKDFYLQPNDLIYVPPLPSLEIRKAVSDYSFVISLFTTTLTTIVLILNLTK